MPPRDRDALSVFRITGLSEDEIWALGDNVNPGGDTTGRADVAERAVTEVGLQVEHDNDPPRHANIRGWPDDKPQRKALALRLARIAVLHVRPATA